MNFKNITKIAAVALLFASIPAIAGSFIPAWSEAQRKRLYLHIQNDTNYNFTLNEPYAENPILGTIDRHTEKVFPQLELQHGMPSLVTGNFKLVSGDISIDIDLGIDLSKTSAMAKIFELTETTPAKATAIASGNFINQLSASKLLSGKNYSDYTYHIYLTLKGSNENKFAGSSIKLDLEKISEIERKRLETGRLEQRLQEHPTTLEQLLRIPRQ